MRTQVHCQCHGDSSLGTTKGNEYCEGTGNPLVHAHNHCVGPYTAGGYRFGDYTVGSVYLTGHVATITGGAANVACGGSYTYTISSANQRWRPTLTITGRRQVVTLHTCGHAARFGTSMRDTRIFGTAVCANDDHGRACTIAGSQGLDSHCSDTVNVGSYVLEIGAYDSNVGTAVLHVECR
jgi:hypothetical protein